MNMLCLGESIRTLRKQHHMTQEDLANKLGVSISAISKWETGKNLPDTDILYKISSLFNISMDELCNVNVASNYSEPLHSLNTSTASPSSTPKVIKNSFRSIGVVLGIIMILFLSIAGTWIFLRSKKEDSLQVYPLTARVTEDVHCGTVYEVAYICNSNPENIGGTSPFILQMSEDWENNTSISSDITIMKISFYTEEDIALQWSTPVYSTYIVR